MHTADKIEAPCPVTKPEVEFSHLPVTALAFVGGVNLLLVGQGPHLSIVDFQTSQRLFSKRIFVNQAIHGIAVYNVNPSRRVIAVWGGKLFGTVVVDIQMIVNSSGKHGEESIGIQKSKLPVAIVHLGDIRECSDWILHCSFAAKDFENSSAAAKAVIVTAHNALVLVKFCIAEEAGAAISELRIRTEQTPLSATTRCMLYSAHAQWISAKRILVTGGTPFGTIIIWSCLISDVNGGCSANAVVNTHYMFTAHEDAAVFDVVSTRNPTIGANVGPELLVASCSDDRTVRVWDISGVLLEFQSLIVASSNDEFIEVTGNLAKPALEPHEMHHVRTMPPLYAQTLPFGPQRLYGHISRVWKVGVVDSSAEGQYMLISLGEDASVQLWKMNYSLSHIATYRNHFGKNAWSYATSVSPANYTCIATGGSDGAVVIVKSPKLPVEADGINRASSTALHQHDPDSRDWTRVLKSYNFIGNQTLLATTSDGHILRGISLFSENPAELLHRESQYKFRSEGHFEGLQSYSTVTVLPNLGIGFVAGSQGDIYCHYGGKVYPTPLIKSSGKIDGLFAHEYEEHSDTGRSTIALLVTQTRAETAKLYYLNAQVQEGICVSVTFASPDLSHSEGASSEGCVVDLCLPEKAIVTSSLCSQSPNIGTMLFLGTRQGTVILYLLNLRSSIEQDSETIPMLSAASRESPTSSFPHHKDAVTCMAWQIQRHAVTQTEHGYLLSTGRDSTYAIHRYSLDNFEAMPILVHRLTLPFGPNIEGFYFTGAEKSMYIYGFRGENFVVLKESTYTEHMTVRCGGAHRVWAFQPPSISNEATFAWTRASKFYSQTASTSSSKWLQPGGHGREIKACAVCPGESKRDDQTSCIFATGAEDTEIRLFEYAPARNSQEGSTLNNVAILREHITGLQHMQFSDDGEYLFSSGGREEFLVWRIQKTPFVSLGVVCESKLPATDVVSDLRIMGFDVQPISRDDSASSELREFLISLVLSNSTIRIYRYASDTRVPMWHPLTTVTCGTACLTVGQYILSPAVLSGNQSDCLGFLSAATNGSISAWGIHNVLLADGQKSQQSPTIKNLAQSKIHQNTIKCLQAISIATSFEETNTSNHIVIAGGDDNALSFSLLQQNTTNESVEINTMVLPRAHGASVTGLVAWNRRTLNDTITVEQVDSTSRSRDVQIRVATVSNDQRLKIWDVEFNPKMPGVTGIQVKKVFNKSSGVADASSIALLGRRDREVGISSSQGEQGDHVRLLVCGVGMEIWDIPG